MDNENKALSSACGQTCSEILPARYDPAAVETWLEDMAKDGWQLTGFDYRFFRTAGTFERSEPRPTRYRLTPLTRKEKEPDAEQRELCELRGWRYAAVISDSFHVWRCDDPGAPEMDTDPVTQAEGYRWLRRRVWRSYLIDLLLVALLFVIVLALPGNGRGFLLNMSENDAPGEFTLWCLFIVGMAASGIGTIRTLRRLYRRLHTGVPLDRPVPYRARQWRNRVLWLVFIVGYFYIVCDGLFNADDFHRMDDDPEAMARARYVDVTDLNPSLAEADVWHAYTKSLELIPRMYQVDHYAADASGVVTDSAHTEYYRLLTVPLAEELERELVEYMTTRSHYIDLTACPVSTLDGFYWGRGDGRQYAVVRLGRAVLTVEYDGPADLRDHPEALAEALAE